MAFARRVDRTHKEVMQALRACGWEVLDTSRLRGFTDLVAWKHGHVRLIEVKSEKGKPTEAQAKLLARGCPVVTLRSADDVAQFAAKFRAV